MPRSAASRAANGEALDGDGGEGGNHGSEGGAEPLVLSRDGDEGEERAAKPSRRRGPLRKKKADKSEGAPEDSEVETGAAGETADTQSDAQSEAQLEMVTPVQTDSEATESDTTLTAE